MVVKGQDASFKGSPAGFIRYNAPHHSRVHVNITNKHSPFILGGILAHELTHHYLAPRGISLPDVDENERFTDLATAYLKLGKLTLNGYYPLEWRSVERGREVKHTYQIGYLSCEDIAGIICAICSFRHIAPASVRLNLSSDALRLLAKSQERERVYKLKQHLVGERQCLHCGKYVTFGFHRDDDEVYCRECGWEWTSIMAESNTVRTEPSRSMLEKLIQSVLCK